MVGLSPMARGGRRCVRAFAAWFALGSAGVAVMLSGLVGGCSVVLDPGEVQCEENADCEALGLVGGTCVANVCTAPIVEDLVWGCLGSVEEPVPDPSQSIDVTIQLIYAVDKTAFTDGTADVCTKLDIDCTASDPTYPKNLVPGPDGKIALSLPQGFDGFFRIQGNDIVATRVYVGRPIVEPPDINQIRLLRPNEYSALAGIAQGQVDETRGTAIFFSVDCQNDPASGVRFEVPTADSKSKEFFLINQAPTIPPNATSTDADGFGGYFNLPVGSTVGKAMRASDDAYIGQSSFEIRANTISFVQVAPTPQ